MARSFKQGIKAGGQLFQPILFRHFLPVSPCLHFSVAALDQIPATGEEVGGKAFRIHVAGVAPQQPPHVVHVVRRMEFY